MLVLVSLHTRPPVNTLKIDRIHDNLSAGSTSVEYIIARAYTYDAIYRELIGAGADGRIYSVLRAFCRRSLATR